MKIHLNMEKSDVRQGATDRGSASITNSVTGEVQFRQGVVLAAKLYTKNLDNAHYQSEKIGTKIKSLCIMVHRR